MGSSRRAFLAQLSTAAAVGLLSQIPARRLWALAPGELVPELDAARLRALALVAVDAARAAGASFADVRLGEGQRLEVYCEFDRHRWAAPRMVRPSLILRVGYGIRVVVDGAWGFAAGQMLTPDAVAQVAGAAVVRARANRPRRPRTLALAPTPRVADGEWAVPIVEDPFAVPAGMQADRQLAALPVLAGIPGVEQAMVGFTWQRALRVFASSEGTLLVQRTALASPGGHVSARAGAAYSPAVARIEGFEAGRHGYEAVSRVDLPEALREAAERAIEESKRTRVPATSAEVGRYDLVLGARAMAGLLTATLAEALDAERVLGYQANRAGTSFAAPPAEILGKYQVGSPLLTVRADRTRPQGAATLQWDDEGVPTEEFILVKQGVIVDYLTDRQCAPELAARYTAQGRPVRSHGCASGMGEERPRVRLPNLTLEPGREALTVEDLIRDTKRGFYVTNLGGSADQQLLNGQFVAWPAQAIRNGQLAEPIRDMAIQFMTPALWKSLDALGGPATVHTGLQGTGLSDRDPLQLAYASVSTAPGRLRQVNVLNTGRTA